MRRWDRAETRARLLGNALYGLKLVHPFISQVCLQVLLCTELADDTYYLIQDVSVRCSYDDPVYSNVFLASIVGGVLWVVGIPVVLFTAVVRDRHRLARDEAEDRREDGRMARQLLHAASAQETIETALERMTPFLDARRGRGGAG